MSTDRKNMKNAFELTNGHTRLMQWWVKRRQRTNTQKSTRDMHKQIHAHTYKHNSIHACSASDIIFGEFILFLQFASVQIYKLF